MEVREAWKVFGENWVDVAIEKWFLSLRFLFKTERTTQSIT
jgi:hypothetical protein